MGTAAAEPKCLWVLIVLVLGLILGGWVTESEGCWEHEKLALLQLKPFFNYQYDPASLTTRNALYDWVEDDDDCCKWQMVECDTTTRRVIGLSLTHRIDVPNGNVPWDLNASLFLPFEELQTLSLQRNNIAACLHNQGFEKLALKLNKLEALDLSDNSFNDSNILPSLFQFSSLKSLNLSLNQLSGPILDDGLRTRGISPIEILDLSWNQLDIDTTLLLVTQLSSIKYLDLSVNLQVPESNNTNGFKRLSRLRNLEALYLRGNKLKNSILSYLGDLSSLKILGLERCGLEGTINIQELNNLINLKELYLRDNPGITFQDNDERQSGLINLEVLSLTLNIINHSMSLSFGPLSNSLKSLSAPAIPDELEGSIDITDARVLNNQKSIDGAAVLANNIVLLQSLALFPSLKTLHFNAYSDYNFALETIIKELQNFSKFEELRLDELIVRSSFFEEVGKIASLKILSLPNAFSNGLLSIQGLLNLKNLEYFETDGIPLGSNFIGKIGGMTSLKILSLPNCALSGNLSAHDICRLTRLQKLDFRKNYLRGSLPDCFSNLTFLSYLDISLNHFSGNLSPLHSLTFLEYIDLSNNQFEIPSSLKPFFNHCNLKYFNGDNNNISAETELHHFLTPRFQLNVISLSCCGDVGPLPKFLYHQGELQTVHLSKLNLTGEFPTWLLENNTRLEKLSLANNFLSGHFGLPIHSPMKLLELDVSNNVFGGRNIPEEIGVYLPSLTVLNMSKNSLEGSIPTSIGNMKLLETLDLSHNRLSGVIPEHLSIGCSSLRVLVLSNNNLQGKIFSVNFNLTNLEELQLAGNNFTGSIPDSLSNCTALSTIDIGDNNLSGRIPRWMGMLSLEEIFMPNNSIEGPIPMEFCQLNGQLTVLDLSMNNISGAIPSCFNLHWINHVHLSKNMLQGSIPNAICNSSELVTLDLSYNQLTGNIPDCIDKLSNLSYLALKHNDLEGEISNQFCQLDKLSFIDLSHNGLSGLIPNCLNVYAQEKVTRVFDEDALAPSGTSNSIYVDPNSNKYINKPLEPKEAIELTTKSISYSYEGRTLRFFSGIDLSSNKLIGEIPHEMGNLNTIVMLNLSHNRLTGPIPPSFSNLKRIESLDLSYNKLSGRIPLELVQLTFLAYFNVSYNNLSGKPPPRTAQFATDFDENSYWGNPFLCGEPLPKNCSTMPTQSQPADEDGDDVGLIDMESFYVTFTVSYIVVILAIAAVLYINPYWRRAWFYYIELSATSCLYFVVDHLPKQFRCCNI